MLAQNGGNIMSSQLSQDLLNITSLGGLPLNIGAGQRIDSLPISSVISGLSSVSLPHHADHSTISGNNSPLSDSGISVDNVSHSSGSNAAAIMNAAAMATLQQSQSK